MREFVIIGDSTCDLSKEIRDEYDLDYVPMIYIIDEKEYPASLEWESLPVKDFYDTMRKGKRITTSQVPAAAFDKKFREALSQGKDVLYIGCSSALSGSVNEARVVAKDIIEENPDAKIVIVDALNSSFGQGCLMMKASEMRKEGKTIDEVAAYLEENKLCMHQVATPDSLSYLKKAGRVTASSAFFGNLIGIHPILISDAKGQNYAVKKVKGKQAVKDELVNMTAQELVDPADQIVYISHADAPELAQELKEMILKKTGCKDVVIGYIGPIVGASVGPGTIGIYFRGEKVTVVGEA